MLTAPDVAASFLLRLPAVGAPGTIAAQKPLGVLEIQQVDFANGVKALVWANDAEPGRVTVRVRFGAGYRAFDAASAVYAPMGEAALVGSGLGELGQNEIDRLATGRKLGFDFAIDDAVFTLTAQTRSDDVADQLYLFAAKLGMPRWDADPVIRAKAASELAYNTYSTSPGGVLNRDLEFLVTGKDPRFATPDPAALQGVTPEGFRKVWEPLLKQGPIEVLVFGEFDSAAIIEQLRLTFGALPPREAIAGDFPSEDETPDIVQESQDHWLLDGSTDLHHLEQMLGVDGLVDEDEEYATLAGYLLTRFGQLPKVGDVCVLEQSDAVYRFKVEELEGRRISQVSLERAPYDDEQIDPFLAS